jgi:hypothetical protein
MSRRIAGVGLAALMSSLALAAPAAAINERVLLDSRAGTAPYAGPAGSSSQIADDTFAIASVRGTVAAYTPSVWASPEFATCGATTNRPTFLSPGATTGPANMDAETIFALPVRGGCDNVELPVHTSQFEVDLGGGFAHVEPIGGGRTSPAVSHRYRYIFEGTGAKVAFRLRDSFLEDNNGILRIRVRDAVAADCDNEGYLDFGVYRSERQCRRLIPARP